MNPAFLGDSYDLVKRFFSQELRLLGYEVAVEPFFTGKWEGAEAAFHSLIGANHREEVSAYSSRTALFLDPDTGVNENGSKHHVSYSQVVAEARKYRLVFAFDQAFSRNESPTEVMKRKLLALEALGLCAMYYNSHARFLFASNHKGAINELCTHLRRVGLPGSRLVQSRA